MTGILKILASALLLLVAGGPAMGQERARDMGIAPGVHAPGPLNAITDVEGVMVGHFTLTGEAGVRTGVTAILPHGGNLYQDKVPAGVVIGNGYGKMMGTTQIIELGEIETPVMLTNTLSVTDAAQAAIEWTLKRAGNEQVRSVNAVVGETNDGRINDIRRRALTKEHGLAAIEAARTGAVAEGPVGAGAATLNFGFKGGIGTSSRQLADGSGGYTVGVLVQTNYGGDLHIMGVPVGRELKALNAKTGPDGSVMIIIATDAPLSDRNLERLARRSLFGIARTGSAMSNGSGDYALAFSTNPAVRRTPERRSRAAMIEDLPNARMTPLFEAVVEATEEAVYNALVQGRTMTGHDGKTYHALPVAEVLDILKAHGALQKR